ncbi:hypothetical protein ACF1G0_33305 [Streptomyces sp. NPDC013953]|uniref:hypothetical protein n=1 Tax=Streptomyces sp. NPDC013953 TaxID=3364868 RepID=UPI0036F63AB5
MVEASDFFLTDEQLRDRFEAQVRDFVFSDYAPQSTRSWCCSVASPQWARARRWRPPNGATPTVDWCR